MKMKAAHLYFWSYAASSFGLILYWLACNWP